MNSLHTPTIFIGCYTPEKLTKAYIIKLKNILKIEIALLEGFGNAIPTYIVKAAVINLVFWHWAL